MSRYTYDDKKVTEVLSLLNGAGGVCSSLEETGSGIQKAVQTISQARKANLVESFVDNKEYLNNLSVNSIAAIQEQCEIITNVVAQIKEYEDANWFTKLFASIGLTGSKLFEGIFGVGEGLVDGLASVVAWSGSKLGADTTALQDAIAFDVFGTLGHEFNEVTGINKYSWYSENSTAANIIEGVGTMTGYAILGTVSGGIVGDLVTGYVADLGMTTQAHMNSGASFEESFSAGTKEAVKGAVFTAVLGGLTKSYAKVGKEALGTADDVAVKGLGSVDDLDNSVRSMQKSVTGLDGSTGKLADIDGVKQADIVGTKTIDGKAVEVKVSDAKGASKTTKAGTTIEKYNITDAADSSKKLGEIEVVTKKDGSVVKTTKTVDPDSGKVTTKTIEKADPKGKTTSIETTKYQSGHKRSVTKITDNGDGNFTKVTKEGHTAKTAKTATTEKITVTKGTDGATTSIKTETFDGKLKSDGTPKKHTSKVGETTETITSGDVQTRVSNTYDSTGKVASTTTDNFSKTGDDLNISRKVTKGDAVVSEVDFEIQRNANGDIARIDSDKIDIDANGVETYISERIEYSDGKVSSRYTAELDDAGKNKSADLYEVRKRSLDSDSKTSTEVIKYKKVVGESNSVIDDVTYRRNVSTKTGKTIGVTSKKVDVDATTGVKTTVEKSANGHGVVNKRVTSSIDAAGARTGDEVIETVNRQGYQRKVVYDSTGNKTSTTVTLASGKESTNPLSVARSQTATVKGKHTHFINDSYITGNKVNKVVSKYDDFADKITAGFRNQADEVHDWLADNKLTKLPTKLYDSVKAGLTNFSTNHPNISRGLGLAGTMAIGTNMVAGGAETPIVMSNQAIVDSQIDPNLHDDYDKLKDTNKKYEKYDSDLLEGDLPDNDGNNEEDSPSVPSDIDNSSTPDTEDNKNTQNREDPSLNPSNTGNNSPSNTGDNSSSVDSDDSSSDDNSSTDSNKDTEQEKDDLVENDENKGDEEGKDDSSEQNPGGDDSEKKPGDDSSQEKPEDEGAQQKPIDDGSSTEPENQQPTQPEQSTPQPNPNPIPTPSPTPSNPSYTTPSVSTPSVPNTPSVEDTPIDYEELEVLDDGLDDGEDNGLLEDSELIDNTDDDLYTIPTPIEPTEDTSTEDGGSSVGPILTGLGLAGAAGVGAKIFLDKKKERELGDEEDADEDEIIADEWNEDNDSFDFMNGEDSPFGYQDQDQEA